MNDLIKIISSPALMSTITVVTALAAFLNILRKNQHMEKVMTVYEGGITIDELMAFFVLLLLIATMLLTAFAIYIGNVWAALNLILIALILLVVFLTSFRLESCYLYLDGTYYVFVKKIKGYIVVQRKESIDFKAEKDTYWGKVSKMWKSSKGWRKPYNSVKVALYTPTVAKATILIPEAELTKAVVVTAYSFESAKMLFEQSKFSINRFDEDK